MKYQVQIFAILAGALVTTPAHSEEYEAASDHEAVDDGRTKHDHPEEGGDFTVVINALDEGPSVKKWIAVAGDPAGKFIDAPRPVGEICRFNVRHEPATHLRAGLEEKRAAVELEEKRTALKEQIRAEVLAELAAEGKVSK
jgi:cellulase/cellobiase CelA1